MMMLRGLELEWVYDFLEAGEYKYVYMYYICMSCVEGAAKYVNNSHGKFTYIRLTQKACTYGGLALE